MPTGHRPPEHSPDALQHPPRRLPLVVPQRRDHREHCARVDLGNGPIHQRRRVVPEARPPLRLALAAVAPVGRLQRQHRLDALPEARHAPRPGPDPRIATVAGDPEIRHRPAPRFRERGNSPPHRPEAKIGPLPPHREPLHKALAELRLAGLRLVRLHVEIQPRRAIIAVPSGPVDRLNEFRRQYHPVPHRVPTNGTVSRRILTDRHGR